MTDEGRLAAEAWTNPNFVRLWAGEDHVGDTLALPRAIICSVVALEELAAPMVLDIASGPGALLGLMLEQLEGSTGVWLDASAAMLDIARERLAPVADRLTFVLGDMTDLTSADLPDQVDVLTTARASHHLSKEALDVFYASAFARLKPGGWIANLDHTLAEAPWDERMKAAKKPFLRPRTKAADHHHDQPQPTVAAHRDGLGKAGFVEIEMPWRAFNTVLLMARKPAAQA